MKVIIENCSMPRFVKNSEMDWTELPDEALAFSTSMEALDFYQQHPFKTAQLVLKFGDPRFDVNLPVEDYTLG